jgi:putative membrane protein
MRAKNYLPAAVLVFMYSCSGSSSNETADSVQAAKDSNKANMDTSKITGGTSRLAASVNEADAQFAVEAANIGKVEVELGSIAGQNAEGKEVKDFGAMMVKDHTESGDKLKSIAATKHIILSTGLSKDREDKLSELRKKTRHDFDKAYMEMMVSGHKKAASLFEDEIKKGSDADLRDFATHTLDVINMHLSAAKKIEATVKK